MKATITCLAASVRVHAAGAGAITISAPESIAVEGEWAVGTASTSPLNIIHGEFEVSPFTKDVEVLVVSKECKDEFGAVIPCSESFMMEFTQKAKLSTHESNALTAWTVGYPVASIGAVAGVRVSADLPADEYRR